jgi:hypothetical protein
MSMSSLNIIFISIWSYYISKGIIKVDFFN